MSEILKVQLEDSEGNVYYMKTDANNVFFEDGESLESKFGTIVTKVDQKLGTNEDGSNVTAAFTAASSRTNLSTGEKISSLFGKIAKWFADLKPYAFSDLVQNASTDDSTKAISAAVVKRLQDQVRGKVNQGGGSGQSGNTVYIGWASNAAGLKCTVDSTDLGYFAFKGSGRYCLKYGTIVTYVNNKRYTLISQANVVSAWNGDKGACSAEVVSMCTFDNNATMYVYFNQAITANIRISYWYADPL